METTPPTLLILNPDPLPAMIGMKEYRFIRADSLDKAMAALIELDVSLCLIGEAPHGLDWLETVREIKAMRADLPIIALLQQPSYEIAKTVLSADYGADYILEHPIDPAELCEKIEACLQTSGLRARRAFGKSGKRGSSIVHQRRMERLKRALEIKDLITNEPRSWNLEALASIYQVSPRTIQRYLGDLKELGIDVRSSKWEGYWIETEENEA